MCINMSICTKPSQRNVYFCVCSDLYFLKVWQYVRKYVSRNITWHWRQKDKGHTEHIQTFKHSNTRKALTRSVVKWESVGSGRFSGCWIVAGQKSVRPSPKLSMRPSPKLSSTMLAAAGAPIENPSMRHGHGHGHGHGIFILATYPEGTCVRRKSKAAR